LKIWKARFYGADKMKTLFSKIYLFIIAHIREGEL